MISTLVFPSALFLCISTLLLLPCPSYYSQPFGFSHSSLHNSFLTDAWVSSDEPTYSSEMFSQCRVKHTGVTIDAGEYALVQ
jgi:hypothetical protein